MKKAALTLAAGALVAAGCSTTTNGANGPAGSQETPIDLDNIALAAYSDCDTMLKGLRKATAERVTPYGLPGGIDLLERGDQEGRAAVPQPKAAPPDHSTTNVHEAGTDEPDLVKTDGRRIVTVAGGDLRVVDAASGEKRGKLDLDRRASQLLVSGDRALVVLPTAPSKAGRRIMPPDGPYPQAGFQLVLADISGTPKVMSRMEVTGSYVDARLVGGVARVVATSRPQIKFPQQKSGPGSLEKVRDAVRSAPLKAWLPRYTVDGKEKTIPCERVSHPPVYTGTSMLSVHSLDLSGGDLTKNAPMSVVADGDTVYGTAKSLYITSNPSWWGGPPVPLPEPRPVTPRKPTSDAPKPPVGPDGSSTKAVPPADTPPPPSVTVTPEGSTVTPEATLEAKPSVKPPKPPKEHTQIHQFAIDERGAPRYLASGSVPGRLLNQYSLSEHEGHLRVATTRGSFSNKSSSGVYVLSRSGRDLRTVGKVTGLGKGERIHSVRFIGPVGYVVTFRQTDPLYSLDLRDPAKPAVTGELKITGFSAYLHPAGDGRLIGVGQEADKDGRIQGSQISLFDVGDPAKPARLAQRKLGKSTRSDVEHNPHAFLYWPKSRLMVIPVSDNAGDARAEMFTVNDDEIKRVGTIDHPGKEYDSAVRRTIVIGDTVWTVGNTGLMSSDMADGEKESWIGF